MIGWLLLACVVGVAVLPRLAVASGLVEWEGGGRKVTIGSPTSIAIISTTALGIGIFGAGGVAISSLGGGAPAGPTSTPVSAPNAPTITATSFADTGDSLRIVLGSFVGSGSDTHDSTDIEVDSAGKDFSSPQYHNVTLGAVLTDTATAIDSGSVVDVRARVKGASGGWSAWDTLSGISMTSMPAVFSSVFLEDMVDGNNSDWQKVEGINEPSFFTSVNESGSDANQPGDSVLLVEGDNGAEFWAVWKPLATKRPDLPGVGEAITWRWYHMKLSTNPDDQYHPMAFGGKVVSPNDTTILIQFRGGSGSKYTFDWQIGAQGDAATSFIPGGASDNNFIAPLDTLTEDVWYRYEMTLLRATDSTLTIKPRVYTHPGGVQILAPADFTESEGGADPLTDFTWIHQGSANIIRDFTGFGNGISNVTGNARIEKWGAIAAFMCDCEDLPFPQPGEPGG